MKRLQVDLGELGIALEDDSWESRYFLDLETGQVVWITGETSSQLERIYEEAYDPESEEAVELAEILQEHDLHEWQVEALLEADAVELGYGSRYIRVPRADSHEAYRDMERFIMTVDDERLRERLWRAIQGRGAFRYFKDVLFDHHRELKRWFAFEAKQQEDRMLDWLESQGIEPILPPAPPAQEPDFVAPTARERLLAEVLAFVQAASQLAGVTRIALIGSLTTVEPDPKDADLLVTVTDDMDLAPLATSGRKLQGHAQSFARGGEVFLADEQGHYLGRTCPWKRCGPGIRLRCDALHCGRRPFLHDDFEAVTLDESLIAKPPIELWPQVLTRVAVPEDVEMKLFGLLS